MKYIIVYIKLCYIKISRKLSNFWPLYSHNFFINITRGIDLCIQLERFHLKEQSQIFETFPFIKK